MVVGKLLCRLGFHRWEHSRQLFDIVFKIPLGFPFYGNVPKNQKKSIPIRICKRCWKKQRRTTGVRDVHWIECELTKKESRDSKLEKLLD